MWSEKEQTMKITTKITVAMNIAIVASMSFLYYDNKAAEIAHEKAVEAIVLEVANKIEKAKSIECLATNIYHEARNEGLTGQRAIAWTTLNRVESQKYPDNICDVVYQAELNENGIPLKNQCQFSFYCDGLPDTVDDLAAWNLAESIAEEVMSGYGKETDPTNGAIMYHAYYVTPYWSSAYEKQARIDSHIFYK